MQNGRDVEGKKAIGKVTEEEKGLNERKRPNRKAHASGWREVSRVMKV